MGDQGVQGLLAGAEVGGRGAVDVGDLLVGELEELPGARGQRVRRQRLEGVANLLLHRLEQGELLGDDALAMRQLGREAGLIRLQFRRTASAVRARAISQPISPPRASENSAASTSDSRHYNLDAV